jgi:hypothetical protein
MLNEAKKLLFSRFLRLLRLAACTIIKIVLLCYFIPKLRHRKDSIMFHRILTVTLAALLAFESPVTAYATQTDPDLVVGSAERTGSTAREFENNDEISGGG